MTSCKSQYCLPTLIIPLMLVQPANDWFLCSVAQLSQRVAGRFSAVAHWRLFFVNTLCGTRFPQIIKTTIQIIACSLLPLMFTHYAHLNTSDSAALLRLLMDICHLPIHVICRFLSFVICQFILFFICQFASFVNSNYFGFSETVFFWAQKRKLWRF